MLNARYLSTLSVLIKHFDQCINTLICDIEDLHDKYEAKRSVEISPFTSVIKELEEDGTATAMIYDFTEDFTNKYSVQIAKFKEHLTQKLNYWDKMYEIEADEDSLLISIIK